MINKINKHWFTALRYHFTAPSFISAVFGSTLALNSNIIFNINYFILLIIAILCNHFALNLTDDYFDYLHGADIATQEQSKYHGGSGVLINKKINIKFIKIAFISFYSITAIIGLYFYAKLGFIILLFGLIGMGSSYFYTAPPIAFGYRGLGELAIFFNFGPLIIIGSYYLQTKTIPLSIIINSLPLGFLMFAMIIFNEMPDFNNDLAANKKTLIVLYGKKIGLYLGIISISLAYIFIILNIILNYINIMSLISSISLITLPLAYKAIKLLIQTNGSNGQLSMIKTHNFTGILLITANIIQAIINHQNINNSYIIIIILLLLYFPVILITKK